MVVVGSVATVTLVVVLLLIQLQQTSCFGCCCNGAVITGADEPVQYVAIIVPRQLRQHTKALSNERNESKLPVGKARWIAMVLGCVHGHANGNDRGQSLVSAEKDLGRVAANSTALTFVFYSSECVVGVLIRVHITCLRQPVLDVKAA